MDSYIYTYNISTKCAMCFLTGSCFYLNVLKDIFCWVCGFADGKYKDVPLKVTAKIKMTGNVHCSFHSFCFTHEDSKITILCTCISTTDFYYSCTFFLKHEKKKYCGYRPTRRPRLHSRGPMCCVWHTSWARECVWQVRCAAFDSFASVTRWV